MVENRQKVKVNPITFYLFYYFFLGGGAFYKVNFLEKYTSNQAQTKLKTLFKALNQPFLSLSKQSQNVKVKLEVKKLTPLKVNPFALQKYRL